ncbi:hypothetical protein [Asanoa siamensis]|uniref:Uncharacterized protein n=1 Tax=Asanoa siamensis TaxID=926357 RepID=A0ABQ4CLG5_9ACTN|nr:hypothetical protein [Asanoa siamensis]GIF72137.1 hypothetical protein Asi02nite_16550 [Asanoa siamensis]
MEYVRAGAEPRWGFADGLQIGLAPLPGPRGLLRVYAPYLGHGPLRVVNFIAVEPTPVGATERGFSELEWSALDGERGKRMGSAAAPTDAFGPLSPGVVEPSGELTVYVPVERFDNGAHVYVRLRFRPDRPYAVAVAGFHHPDSVPLARLTLTATMGNWARLRRLHLASGPVTPAELWPGFTGDRFTAHARFGLDALGRDADGAVVVSATTDEAAPTTVAYAEGTAPHWHYEGRTAVQTWRAADPDPDLEVLVNGRACYWASQSPIPGGVSFENFEFGAAYRPGQEYEFSVEPS